MPLKKMCLVCVMRSPRLQPWIKSLALFLIAALVLPTVSWAFEQPNWLSPGGAFPIKNPFLELPENLGKIVEAVPGREVTVIIIQDLHCNYEAQDHIAGILDFLAQHQGLRLVAIEGSSLPVNVTKLSTFPVPAVKASVGRALMRTGEISGPEFYAATGQYPIILAGIENPELYRAEQQSAGTFINSENQGFLADLGDAFEEIKPKLYNPALLKFDAYKSRFRSGTLSFYQYLKQLDNAGRQFMVVLDKYPQLESFLATGSAVPGPAVDMVQLIAEMDQLDLEIREHLYQQPQERELHNQLSRLEQLEKLLNIGATPSDLKEIRSKPGDYAAGAFLDFLARAGSSTEMSRDILRLDKAFGQALAFYNIADRRSVAFAENVVARMQDEKTKLAVLVAGGYHSPVIMEQLKRQGISTIAISPRLNPLDPDNAYLDLLQNKRSPLERLLEQCQNAMMKEPYFAPSLNTIAIPQEKELGKRKWRYQALELLLKLGLVCLLLKKSAGSLELDQLQEAYNQRLHPPAGAKGEMGYTADSHAVTLNLSEASVQGNGLVVPVALHSDNENAGQAGSCIAAFCPERAFATNGPQVSPIAQVKVAGIESEVYPNSMQRGVEEILSRQARHGAMSSMPLSLEEGWIPQGMDPVSSASLMASFVALPEQSSGPFQRLSSLRYKLFRLARGITTAAGIMGWLRGMGNNAILARLRGAIFLRRHLDNVRAGAQLPTQPSPLAQAIQPAQPAHLVQAIQPIQPAPLIPGPNLAVNPGDRNLAVSSKPETQTQPAVVEPAENFLTRVAGSLLGRALQLQDEVFQALFLPVKWARFLYGTSLQFISFVLSLWPEAEPGMDAVLGLHEPAAETRRLSVESLDSQLGQALIAAALPGRLQQVRPLLLRTLQDAPAGARWLHPWGWSQREGAVSCFPETAGLRLDAIYLPKSWLAIALHNPEKELAAQSFRHGRRWFWDLEYDSAKDFKALTRFEELKYRLLKPLVLAIIRRQAARLDREPRAFSTWMLSTSLTASWLQARSPRAHMLALLESAAKRYPHLTLAQDARARLLAEPDYANDKRLIIQMVADSLAARVLEGEFDHLPAAKKTETLEFLQWLLQRLEPGETVRTSFVDAVLGVISIDVPRTAQVQVCELLKRFQLQPVQRIPRQHKFLGLLTSA